MEEAAAERQLQHKCHINKRQRQELGTFYYPLERRQLVGAGRKEAAGAKVAERLNLISLCGRQRLLQRVAAARPS